jgi:hypothetical protein
VGWISWIGNGRVRMCVKQYLWCTALDSRTEDLRSLATLRAVQAVSQVCLLAPGSRGVVMQLLTRPIQPLLDQDGGASQPRSIHVGNGVAMPMRVA